ncbi:MAG: SOS response-associated peptidase [Clostridiaceae bacterium]|nr:SOS response-associated peptidase [Clostridiaceae bacterium]
MCGRFVIFSEEENSEINKILKDISEKYKATSVEIKLGDIYPTDLAPVVTKEKNDENLNLFKWGFPFHKEKNSLLINARGETLEEKVTFKNLLMSKRCLIPATAFYEWKSVGKKKHKYLIKPNTRDFFYMAGLYNTVIDMKGKPYTAFVIITTEANDQMSSIHHRMPLILSKAEETELWVNNSYNKLSTIKDLIRPYDERLSIQGEILSLFD